MVPGLPHLSPWERSVPIHRGRVRDVLSVNRASLLDCPTPKTAAHSLTLSHRERESRLPSPFEGEG